MAISTNSRRTAPVHIAILLALVATMLAPTGAAAKTKPVELRVIASSGNTLADYVQYAGGSYKVRASRKATCFGDSNPSSNHAYKLRGSNPLSALTEASRRDRALRPLRITDAFYGAYGSFGVCRIGDFSFSQSQGAYWYNANDYLAASAGPNQIPVRSGADVLWYLTNGGEPISGPNVLELRAPARAKAGKGFRVKVLRHSSDGGSEPAAGVSVAHASAPTNAAGKTTVGGSEKSALRLQATGSSDDVPSGVARVCIGRHLRDCRAHPNRTIYGSSHRDRIKGTKGKDKIGASTGSDVIDVRSGGPDKVVCGSGNDTVIRAKHQRGLKLKGCEKVKRRS